jgi:hypothetical protein
MGAMIGMAITFTMIVLKGAGGTFSWWLTPIPLVIGLLVTFPSIFGEIFEGIGDFISNPFD